MERFLLAAEDESTDEVAGKGDGGIEGSAALHIWIVIRRSPMVVDGDFALRVGEGGFK